MSAIATLRLRAAPVATRMFSAAAVATRPGDGVVRKDGRTAVSSYDQNRSALQAGTTAKPVVVHKVMPNAVDQVGSSSFTRSLARMNSEPSACGP